MFSGIIEFTSLVLFIGCFWHAASIHGRDYAQQWFVAGYLSSILRETIMQVAFGVYLFAPTILRIGAAPALVTLLLPCLGYIALCFAQRLAIFPDVPSGLQTDSSHSRRLAISPDDPSGLQTDSSHPRKLAIFPDDPSGLQTNSSHPRTRTLALVFLIATSIALPIEATAAQTGWWTFQTTSRVVLGGIPLFAPLIWGGGAAIFYAAFARVRATPLPDRGKLYTMITLSPGRGIVQLAYILLLGLLIG